MPNCRYCFEIGRTSTSYSIGAFLTPKSELLERYVIEFEAVCREPPRLANRKFSFCLIGDRNLEGIQRKQLKSVAKFAGVGILTTLGQRSDYRGEIPFDMAIHLQALLSQGALRSVILSGAPSFRGKAEIAEMTMQTAAG